MPARSSFTPWKSARVNNRSSSSTGKRSGESSVLKTMYRVSVVLPQPGAPTTSACVCERSRSSGLTVRSEEHTSELQSRQYLVCRLLLEKKKKTKTYLHHSIIT